MKDANVSKSSIAADVWRNNRWALPDPIDTQTSEVWEYIKGNYTLNSNLDAIAWKVAAENKFYSKNLESLKRKINTKSRLFKWGVVHGEDCVLCCKDNETIDHCLYKCEFVRKIWENLLPICNCPENFCTWRRLIRWFCIRALGKNAASTLRRLILTASVYCVYRARNMMIFANEDPDNKNYYQEY
ncbi:uncharacterized protein LOC126674357 [Mercurialis annua]|uniref:uncharacterized protein LOC126674357 n=1 Tax=Mercurialis annua TaxID=3986 RepID=UPI002160AF3D|nr:uncharacterized protein LOC126674357 [Mercurialis annua]